MRAIVKISLFLLLLAVANACSFKTRPTFGVTAPVKKIVCSLPFPTDLIYASTPDPAVVVGTKQISPAIFEIGGYEIATGKNLWKLPFPGEIVGQTDKQIAIYEEKSSTVHFVNPRDGAVTRKVSPAPAPLSSKTGLAKGMAFTDEMYLTTKPLYGQVRVGNKEDGTWPIGVTAKAWETDEKKWFVAPVKQIVIIEYKPVILGDKVLLINTRQAIGGPHSYQNISLKTGHEIFRGNSEGQFSYVGKDFFMDQEPGFVRRIDPVTNNDLWKIEDDFVNASVSAIGDQITLSTPHKDHTRTIRIVDAGTGKILKKFDLPDMGRTNHNADYLTADGKVWLNFRLDREVSSDTEAYNYWVGYDEETKQPEWRSDMQSQSISSLFQFAGEKMSFEN